MMIRARPPPGRLHRMDAPPLEEGFYKSDGLFVIMYSHHMRTIIEIPDSYVKRLDELKRQRRVSRSELVREAVERYLESSAGTVDDVAFGVSAAESDEPEDAVAYQQRLRAEWD